MKSALVILGLVALAVTVSGGTSVTDESTKIVAEMRRQSDTVKNKTLHELATELVAEAKAAGKDVMDFIAQAVNEEKAKSSSRKSRSLDQDEYSFEALLNDIAAVAGDKRAGRAEEESADSTATEEEADETRSGSKQNQQKSKIKAAIIPKPVLIPIPGPPGPPGPPGLPGLPGIPGKSPNLKGLKAILLARLAKILLLIQAVAVLCIVENSALLATTLGLTLPLYGKFAKAGVVVPIGEQEHSGGSYAPAPPSYVNQVQEQVYAGIEKGKAAYGKRQF